MAVFMPLIISINQAFAEMKDQATPVILSKIQDMAVRDALLRIFFSNFTITPPQEGNFKGSDVVYILKEPWAGFF
jgi:hypothetical protein